MTKTDHIKEAADLIKIHEGFSGVPYRCPAGKITIGYGRNLEANPLTKDEATVLMMNDIRTIDKSLTDKYPYFLQLTSSRRVVLISMAFQMGLHGLAAFRKMHKHLEVGNYDMAAVEMLDSHWAKQTPNRAKELSEKMRMG